MIDLGSGTSPVDDPYVAQKLDSALRSDGFCYLTGHGVPERHIQNIFAANRQFHALPEVDKTAISINPTHRGYIGQGTNTTLSSSVETPTRPNSSESFIAMQQVDPDHPRWGTAIFGPNQWPDSLPSKFRIDLESYYGSMECLARQLVQRLAVALGYSFDAFNEFFLDPTVFLRLLRYPIYENNTPAGTYGSAPHTDHGFLTLVAQDMNAGLEVCSPDKGWLSVKPIPGTFVLNVADMLSLASGGRWPSTPHRVVLSNSERYSVAFFFDPSFDTTMQPLGSLNKSIENKQSIHYGTYLMNRFDENYDYRS